MSNRKFFRSLGFAKKALQTWRHKVVVSGIREPVEAAWAGQRRGGFYGPNKRPKLWISHLYSRMIKGMKKAKGAQQNRIWTKRKALDRAQRK